MRETSEVMTRAQSNRFSFRHLAALGSLVVLAACQSTGNEQSGGPIDFGLGEENQVAAAPVVEEGKVTDVELRAYCPKVQLRSGTAYYNTYTRGQEQNPKEVIYQASINDVTRSCNYSGGQLAMTVAAAGRVVPGPKGTGGSVTMPIRVAVVQDENVIYSQLHQQQVQVAEVGGATQFVFTDPAIVMPAPSQRDVIVYVGYDEGPYNTP